MYGRQYFVIFATCGNFFLNGLIMGWHAPGLIKLLDEEQSPLGHAATPGQISMIVASTYSAIFVLPIGCNISNRIGRKPIMILAAIFNFAAWMAIGSATDVYVLCFGKFLGSVGLSGMYTVTLLYLSEIASDDIRGLALTMSGVLINYGILTEYIIGPFLSYRMLGYAGALFSVICFIILFFIPESPSFYLLKGKPEEARKIYIFLGKSVEHELQENILMLANKTEQISWSDKVKMLFRVKRNLKAFTILSVLFILQAFSGFSAVVMHMTVIFESAGSSIPAHIATIIVGVTQLIPCMVSSGLVDRIGRKTLLLASCFVTALTNLVLGLVFYLERVNSPVARHVTWLPLVCLVVFMFFYWIGLGVIPVGLSAELLDVSVKDVGGGICIILEIVCAIFVTSCFNGMNTTLGSHGTFWLFSACCLLNFVFIYCCLPETKRKSYSEIQALLRKYRRCFILSSCT